jgi:hypothetical protein
MPYQKVGWHLVKTVVLILVVFRHYIISMQAYSVTFWIMCIIYHWEPFKFPLICRKHVRNQYFIKVSINN